MLRGGGGGGVADLIAVRDWLPAQNKHITQYAITFPTRSVEQVGLAQVIRNGAPGGYVLRSESRPIEAKCEEDEISGGVAVRL